MYCGPEPITDWYRDIAAHLKVRGKLLGEAALPLAAVQALYARSTSWPSPAHSSVTCLWSRLLMPGPLQSVDPNHLVSTGAEGFFDQTNPRAGEVVQKPVAKSCMPVLSPCRSRYRPSADLPSAPATALPLPAGSNPAGSGTWSSNTGQDFVSNSAVPGIDYAVIHMW